MSTINTLAALFLLGSTLTSNDILAQKTPLIIYNAPHLGETEVSTDNGVSWHPAGSNVYNAVNHGCLVTDVFVTYGLDTLYTRDLGVSWHVNSRPDPYISSNGGVKKIGEYDITLVKAVVSPNPTSGITTVRFTRAATFDVELISPSGRPEWNTKSLQTNSNNDLLFDLSWYTPGIYLIVFRDRQNDSHVVLKVAVKP